MIEHTFNVTEEESVTLGAALWFAGDKLIKSAVLTNRDDVVEKGKWLMLMGDLVKGQRRSQQKLEGG